MKLLVWLCLLGCLASASALLLHEEDRDLLTKILPTDSKTQNSSTNSTSRDSGGFILQSIEETIRFIDHTWRDFRNGVLGLMGFGSDNNNSSNTTSTSTTTSTTTGTTTSTTTSTTTTTEASTTTTTESSTTTTTEASTTTTTEVPSTSTESTTQPQ
ncbi:cell wall integrity and stress response component 3-like isoform X1 [Drosophila ficusphila]|uniref:cell wall integrity and stress response component 3-like isoform X1 n=1 Tax=Drosophila ficusphila TaxID=30025 RepID=UPI0007E7A7B4|nr:cell wall integrity and stress response component 3-like isoform X1 [Drosophila ficusphila]